MTFSHSCFCSPNQISLKFSSCSRPRWNSIITASLPKDKDKIIVILGATGCGKSGLSVNLASHFPSEIINSDKMQVYRGLDITTNKIPLHERNGVPHHLFGEIDPLDEFTQLDFRIQAANVVSDITSRQKLPILVGGSNSFIYSLLVNTFNPKQDVFDGSHMASSDLRYRCCFLWMDVAIPILLEYLSIRVDDMLELGMFEELAEFYNPDEAESMSGVGIRKAIGVPEFDKYFEKYRPDKMISNKTNGTVLKNQGRAREAYEEAVNAIKVNTHVLAKRQIEKISQLKRAGWDINVLNATEAFRAVVNSEPEKRPEIWKKDVLEPSFKIVKRFFGK